MDTAALDNAKYVSLTSFKKDGSAVSLPIWLQGSGGTYVMMTADGSYKVKRIRNNPAIQLQVCNMKGVVADGAVTFDGNAQIVEGPEAAVIEKKVRARYGIMGKLMTAPMKLMAKLKPQPAVATVGLRITLTP
jgi:PPOX class probable F420-dependent enzyme